MSIMFHWSVMTVLLFADVQIESKSSFYLVETEEKNGRNDYGGNDYESDPSGAGEFSSPAPAEGESSSNAPAEGESTTPVQGKTCHRYTNEPKRSPKLNWINQCPNREDPNVVCQDKKCPYNAEIDLPLLVKNFITPNDLFFVRSHWPTPHVDMRTYKLQVIKGYKVQNYTTLLQLKEMYKEHTITTAIQCGGNRRVEMNQYKKLTRLLWAGGAIGNANWTGILLSDVLAAIGITLDNTGIFKHVGFEGLDLEQFAKNDTDEFKRSGEKYKVSIPIEKALDPRGSVMLAYEMNGAPLSQDHGYPLRVVAPGIVGARNVKWLSKIELRQEEAESYHQRKDYKVLPGNITSRKGVQWNKYSSIYELPVQSKICDFVYSRKDMMLKIFGYAWSGKGKVLKVEVTIDEGRTWKMGGLIRGDDAMNRNAWVLWKAEFPVYDGKPVEAWSKATDSSEEPDNVQPPDIKSIWNMMGVKSNAVSKMNYTGENTSPATAEGESSSLAPVEGEYTSPATAEGESSSPAPAEGKFTSPAPAEGESTSPAPAEGESSSPAPAEGESSSPAPAEGESSSPAPAEGESTSPPPAEGESTSPAPAEGESSSPAPAEGKTCHRYNNEPKRSPKLNWINQCPNREDPGVVCQDKKCPYNAEIDLPLLVKNFITPNDLFFVRSHWPTPDVDVKSYKLQVIEGFRALSYTFSQLRETYKEHTITTAIQCGGNRRVEMNQYKKLTRLLWAGGAIGNANWTGILLSDVIASFGITLNNTGTIKHVGFEGLDVEEFAKNDTGEFKRSGEKYKVSIPIEKALDARGSVMLAYGMNGAPLSRDHGYPLRVVAPGIVGARNVKWLSKIELRQEEAESYHQRKDYKVLPGNITSRKGVQWNKYSSIYELPVQSKICDFSFSRKDKILKISGYAWSGKGRVLKVEVTIDEGKTWKMGDLFGGDDSMNVNAWVMWKAEFPVNDGGTVEAWSKATDSSEEPNNLQPPDIKYIWNMMGVKSNAVSKMNYTVSLY